MKYEFQDRVTMLTEGKLQRRKRLELRLIARQLEGLLQLLDNATGKRIGERYRVLEVLAMGGQSFVFRGMDELTSREVVVKQPAFDYRRPMTLTVRLVATARSRLFHEFASVSACGNSRFAAGLAAFHAPPIVPAAADCPSVANEEAFVVQELVPGTTLSELALGVWRDLTIEAREAIVRNIAHQMVEFLHDLERAGWVYTDINPDNFLLERATGILRVIDGGGLLRTASERTPLVATHAFTTPRLFAALSGQVPFTATSAAMLPCLGKLLHFLFTRREPLHGTMPDLKDVEFLRLTSRGQLAIMEMLALDDESGDGNRARQAVAQW